ncbi:MAG: response regulator transcription factor [Ruminococcus sp.]|uniref:response regulator transcription factor n=1 Tax=Ruminococcus sp. TaxID=41978 RepID=UPI0025E4B581|nr:response regulator transcription factor [Ruminococcus sp.]MCR5539577.1 response regulator transcription factor [Ruminococcus sp.]
MPNILIIDDDTSISEMLSEALENEGYSVTKAYSGTEAVMILSQSQPDLILLDLMLPGMSGEELLPKIKDIPVIVVSAKADISDKVGLLLGGAADYITKPFDISELLARITVQLRKNINGDGNTIRIDDLTLCSDKLTVIVDQTEIRLTRTECAILKLLMQNPHTPIGKTTILEKISYDTPDCTERSLKQHISNIRHKLQAVNGKDYIEAVYGIGFKLKS